MLSLNLLSLLLAATGYPLFVQSRQTTDAKNVPRNAVLLSQVTSLTLHDGKLTNARRTSPVPQLKCVGPKEICKLYTIGTLRCTNEGSDYDAENAQWSCRSQLPEEFKLGSTEVGCEGYESSNDPYVLKGSCGVEYRLLLTEKGEEKYGRGGKKSQQPFTNVDFGRSTPKLPDWGRKEEGGIPGTIFMVLFLLVAGIIVYNLVKACLDDSRQRRPGGNRLPRSPRGGGGGGNDNDDPPPPYDYRPPPPRKSTPRTSIRTSSSSRTQRQDEGWRPGFWTGAAAGAAGGYMAGRRTAGTQTQQQQQPQEVERQQRGAGSWLFGGGGGSAHNRGTGDEYTAPSVNSPSHSSSRYESTGFGGTTRR